MGESKTRFQRTSRGVSTRTLSRKFATAELLVAVVSRTKLQAHCERSPQFESEADARRSVARLFRTRARVDGNVSSALAELVVFRHFPGSETNLGLAGCDFRLGRRRFEVKSIYGRNLKFLLNRASHDSEVHYSRPPHYYVFVRSRELGFVLPATVLVAYRARVCAAAKLESVLRGIRARRGSVPMLGQYLKLLPSDLGFPPEARGRRVSIFE
jgi:hypothetical protein